MTKGFSIITPEGEAIRFSYYREEAPLTCRAFDTTLPFTRSFYHARVSGEEIWIDDVPPLDVIQENASVFTEPGEVVVGPVRPVRTRTANCFGIYYGPGKGLDAANIFAAVFPEDLPQLAELGTKIWKQGALELTVIPLEEPR